MEWFKNSLEMASTITDLIQKLNIKYKTRTLKRKMETLASRQADIDTQLNIEERPGKKRKEEVKNWSKRFERLSCEVGDVVQKVATSIPLQQLTLGSSLDKLIREAEQLHEEGRFSEGLTLDVKEPRGYERLVGELVGQAFQKNLEDIWDYLMSEEIQIIGVQGMGGIGKTTLVTHIYNRIVNDRVIFERCCWVTMSQDCSIGKLQDAIAEQFQLDLENKNDEWIRAGRLWRALSGRKFIIILDDVWEYYSLEKVGIPLGRNGCKLIMTSRNEDVCHQMNCDKVVKVLTLSEQEAWCLFRENLKHGSLLSSDVEEIARAVSRECAGLPIGIVVLSGIMKGVNDIHEWRNTLKELQKSKFKAKRMEDEVFTVLLFSYHHLRDSIMQQCFLHIALYPEAEEIHKEELIQYFIDSELIERGATRREEFDKGNTILNQLVKSCLLEEGIKFPNRVKMHDLVRDMGINITKGRFMVIVGQRLREIPDEKEWVESLEKVSLMGNNIKEISPNISPRCLNISTLFLQENPLVSIPNSFFKHMQTLKFLNLSETSIEKLPDSFSDLENLTALHLNGCLKLRSLPSLAKMKALRTLVLFGSGIEETPQGMERLRSLIYLNLGETKGLEGMQWPTGILPQLSHLQHLNFMKGPKIMKAEELMSLTKLESLHCWFDDANEFSTYIKYLHSSAHHVNHWDIALGASSMSRYESIFIFDIKSITMAQCNLEVRGELFQLLDDVDELYLGHCQGVKSMSQWGTTFLELKKCAIYNCEGMETVISDSRQHTFLPKLRELVLFCLRTLRAVMSDSLQPTMTPGGNNFFSSLTHLSIFQCPRIKKLLTPLLLPLLTHVEEIWVGECEELDEIIAIEDDDHDDPILGLPKLVTMRLENLPQLKSICGVKWMMKCDSLKLLNISKCPKLERIPMKLHIPPNHHQEEDPVPSTLESVTVSSVLGWSDANWKKRRTSCHT